jgi:glycosyl transferase family 25
VTLSRADIGVWLISLPQDQVRRNRIGAQLDELGIDWTWFSAIDGRLHTQELLLRANADAYARNMGAPILPGKLGVYASHLAVWVAFLASQHKAALILEDDTVLHDDFGDALDAALAGADQWDLVRFNCVRAKWPVRQGQLGRWQLNAYIGPFTGNACYLIHREVAERILPRMWPQTRALDHELNRFFHHDYRQFGLEPWASHTDDGGTSTITGTGFALVEKPHWTRRLPHYLLKAANYFRRTAWLLRRRWVGSSTM